VDFFQSANQDWYAFKTIGNLQIAEADTEAICTNPNGDMQDGFDCSAWVIEDIVFLLSVILLQNQLGYIVQYTTRKS